jgi:iron complex outermembrane receptor protein
MSRRRRGNLGVALRRAFARRGSGLSRGFHMRGLTLLQDGVPINLADDNGDFQELEPIFFDHLEVYRGANALRFGSGTLGGAINGVTPTGRTARGIYLRGDAGGFDSVRGLVSAGVASERVDACARSAPTARTATATMPSGTACVFRAMSG